MIGAKAIQGVEQVAGALRTLAGCQLTEVLGECDGYEDYSGFRAESPGGDAIECWPASVTEAEARTT